MSYYNVTTRPQAHHTPINIAQSTQEDSSLLNCQIEEQLGTISDLSARVDAIKSIQFATDQIQKKNDREITKQTADLREIQMDGQGQDEKLHLLEGEASRMLESLKANNDSLMQSREEIGQFATSPILPNAVPANLLSVLSPESCLHKLRAIACYPCTMLGIGACGAVTTGLIFKTTLAATLGGVGGALAGGVGIYAFNKFKWHCDPILVR